ncbi:MAG TPA: hypothetical protein VHE55_11350 [Fimbriimonadaceae bacterium]|nr:hypothetical protein [Fimbriimonadaceae bacterium]
MRRVHRLATEAEREKYPNAYTFNRMTGRFHNRAGFEVAERGDGNERGRRTKEVKG